MLNVTETFDLLRGRFARCRQGRSFGAIAPEIGVHHSILGQFARGKLIKGTQAQHIEAWCQRQEEGEHADDHRR